MTKNYYWILMLSMLSILAGTTAFAGFGPSQGLATLQNHDALNLSSVDIRGNVARDLYEKLAENIAPQALNGCASPTVVVLGKNIVCYYEASTSAHMCS